MLAKRCRNVGRTNGGRVVLGREPIEAAVGPTRMRDERGRAERDDVKGTKDGKRQRLGLLE